MAKRIFRAVVLTSIFSVLLTAAIIVVSLYSVHETNMIDELRQEADSIACALNLTDDDLSYLDLLTTNSRITLVSSDGTVLYDNMVDSERMENHIQRPEIVQALQNGFGESRRISSTLSETTYYYALSVDDGSILRIANTRSSMLGTFFNVLPLILGMLLFIVFLALLMARKTAQRIVAPVNALNLDHPLENDAYDELSPLLTRMHQQHIQLYGHMQALENARAELAAVMENMREGMILLDRRGHLLSMNESAAQIFGADPKHAAGNHLLSVSRDADLHTLAEAALAGIEGELLLHRGDRHYRIYASPVLKENAICGTVLLILDVTERFAAEESRQEFTANVSHELKTPLTSISGFAEIIRDGIAQPQDVQHFAGMICKESARLMTLVNDILELSQLDEKQNIGEKETVPVFAMLRDLCSDFSRAAESKKLSLSLSGEEAEIEGYPALLREMFFNLIDNAVKYTPEGGSISVSVEHADTQIICCVSDNGIGIPAEHQPHVFERFYRVDKSHSRATGGTGLGLAIVKHAAIIHHADVKLVSQEGLGTSVSVSFDQNVPLESSVSESKSVSDG